MRIQEKLKSFLKLVVYSAVVSISSVFLTTGCQNDQPKDPLTVEEREWLTGHDGKIVLAHDPDAKPIDYLDDKDRFRGLAADYVHLIEKKLNFEFNIPRVKTWAEVLKKAKNKEIDVLCAITETPEREKWLLFTKPYIIIPTVILVRETIKESLTPDKMKGMKVTFTKGWVIDGYLRENYGYLDFDPSVDEQTAMNKVSLGEAEAWVTALTTSSILIEKHKITNLRVAGEMDLQFKLAIASRKDWPILNQILQKGLSLINEEERSAIFKKWIHIEGTSQISRKVWLGLIITAAAILLLIIATILWNRTLRLRVAKKTIELRDELDERRLAEEALRESEQQYRSLVESTEDSIYLVDRNSTYLFMNEKHLSRLGLQPDEILGRIYGEFHSEDDTQEFAALMEKIFETGQSIQQEHRSLKDNRHFLRTLSPIKGPKGRTRAITVVSKDITERGRLEEVLRESEEKFRTFTEMAPVGVFVTDADGLTTYWNKRLCEITGMQVVDGLGAGWADGVHPDDRERVFKEWYESAEKRASFSCEYRFVDRDGAVTYTIGQAIPLIDASSCVTGYVGTITDVTDLKRAEAALRESEEKLARSEKMEAMGLMAGGVAHDLNNILSGVVSLPELLLMNLPEDSPIRKPIKTIQESGMRAADVVEDLMTIARGVASSKEPLNLNTMVEEYLKSAEHLKLERTHSFVSFKMELDPDLLNMNGSPTHIKKILMNLAANASEAIEGSGTVTISTLNQYLDMPLKGYEDVRTGEYAVVTVSDDGSGISPGDLERIFEPFYTKKVMGRAGTGLGLAVVWNTTQDYNGYINVNSSEKGTTFELYFPVTREEVADEKEEVPLQDYLGHGEKILVVDDDENQREIASGMLTQLGYNAESVSSGEDAIEYIKEHSVDLIVLDMVMPKGINGRKTYEEIIKIRPGQKAIIASGHAQSKEVDIAQELGAGKYVKKPYILEKIGVAVKEELEK